MRKRPTPIRGTVDRPLAPRWFLVRQTGRDPKTILKHCQPVACDTRNRALLYDVADAVATLEEVCLPARRLTRLDKR